MDPCSNCHEALTAAEAGQGRTRCTRCSPGRPRAARLATSPQWSKVKVDEALALREAEPARWTFKALGERYGVTKQAVERAVNAYLKRRTAACNP